MSGELIGNRRLKRKTQTDIEMFQPSSRVKKIKKEKLAKNRPKPVFPPNPPLVLELCDLPDLVIREIIKKLPVDDIESLAQTNQFFCDFIYSDCTTSADVPFKDEDILILEKQSFYEKKPLLKLRCKNGITMAEMGQLASKEARYFMNLQLSLLDFSKLRELDLVPHTGSNTAESRMQYHNVFNELLLKTIHRRGTLSRVEVFDVLVDDESGLVLSFVSRMTRLRDLGLHVLTPTNLRKSRYTSTYLPMLERVVSESKAAVLRLNVMAETKRSGIKILKSNHIETIRFCGPCSFNAALIMKNLKKVEINYNGPCCKACPVPGASLFDLDSGSTHMPGMCGLLASSLYENCPKIEEFSDVSLRDIDPNQSFSKWNMKVKKRFYKEYLKEVKDGEETKDFKVWVKERWFRMRYPPARKKK